MIAAPEPRSLPPQVFSITLLSFALFLSLAAGTFLSLSFYPERGRGKPSLALPLCCSSSSSRKRDRKKQNGDCFFSRFSIASIRFDRRRWLLPPSLFLRLFFLHVCSRLFVPDFYPVVLPKRAHTSLQRAVAGLIHTTPAAERQKSKDKGKPRAVGRRWSEDSSPPNGKTRDCSSFFVLYFFTSCRHCDPSFLAWQKAYEAFGLPFLNCTER